MSRSKQKSAFVRICGGSDKVAKRLANRVVRKRAKIAIDNGESPPQIREVTNAYKFPSDGKAGKWASKKQLAANPKWVRK
jgi:hypothetical protein